MSAVQDGTATGPGPVAQGGFKKYKDGRIASAKHTDTHTIRGTRFVVVTRVAVYPIPDVASCVDVRTTFDAHLEGRKTWARLGEMHGYTIDKTKSNHRHYEAWHGEFLHDASKVKYDTRCHASLNDDIEDLTKAMLLLYNKNGMPRTRLSHTHRDWLSSSTIHFIETFMVKPGFVGRQFGKPLMKSYINALAALDNGHAVTTGATITLSPAPMRVATDALYASGLIFEYDYRGVIYKLMKKYRQSGFEMILRGPREIKGPISIMAMRI